MKLSMIVVMTSCAPNRAFRNPGIAPHRNPVRQLSASASTIARGPSELQRHAEPRRRDGSDIDLSFAADIEESGAERHGDGEPGEDQGRRVQERTPDGGGRPYGALHERRIRRDGVVASSQHDKRAEDEGDQDGYNREEQRSTSVLSSVCPRPPLSGSRRSSLKRSSPRPACHQEAELFVRGVGSDFADDVARVHHEDPVGERADLLQLQRDEQDGLAFGALLQELAVDELYSSNVHAAGRLRGDYYAGVAG